MASAVDGHGDAGDERRVVRRQEGDALRHLLRETGPAQRVRLLTAAQELLVQFGRHAAALLQLGDDHAGANHQTVHQSIDFQSPESGYNMQRSFHGLFFLEKRFNIRIKIRY